MKLRRCAAVLGAAALGLVSLTGCSKPTPMATVLVGNQTWHTEASCYSHDDKAASDQSKCQDSKGNDVKKIHVEENDLVSIDVDPSVADNGWYLQIGSQRSDVTKKTFQKMFNVSPQLFSNGKHARMRIVEQDTSGDARGVWNFELVYQS